MANIQPQNVVGYVRVSTESQIDNTSIQEQRKKISAFCISQGWNLVEIFADEGESASTIERNGYQSMMEYVKNPANAIKGIVVLKADRIHRQLRNLLVLIQDELEPLGIAFISVSERFDTSNPQGMLFLQMIGSFAEFERAVINERTKGGRLATATQGRYAGGQVPYGYGVVDGEVMVIDKQADIVRQIYSDYIDGSSTYRIAKTLNREGIKTKSGKFWTPTQIRYILMTETYTGFNKYDGKKERNNIRQKNVFPSIISRQKWNKVQTMLQKNKRNREGDDHE